MNLINTFFILIQSAASQGMLWALLAIGVYLTFRILDIADLTAEGSFPLGAGIAAVSITNGLSPFTASLLGFCGGLAAGFVSGIGGKPYDDWSGFYYKSDHGGTQYCLVRGRYCFYLVSNTRLNEKYRSHLYRPPVCCCRDFVAVSLLPHRDWTSSASNGRQSRDE